MQTFTVISISGGKSAMALPLVIIVSLSMIKDAFEDYKRHKSDAKENDATTLVFKNREFKITKWKDLICGDIVKIMNDEPIPADILTLHSSDQKGNCYVETKNLDGETNLKLKITDKNLQNEFDEEYKLKSMEGQIDCE